MFINSGGGSTDMEPFELESPDEAMSALRAARSSAIYARPGIDGIGRADNAVRTGFNIASSCEVIALGSNLGSSGFV